LGFRGSQELDVLHFPLFVTEKVSLEDRSGVDRGARGPSSPLFLGAGACDEEVGIVKKPRTPVLKAQATAEARTSRSFSERECAYTTTT
jgi:hypothetical protein